ncbi:EAL domain-containing protein [Campylobacter sp. RM12327]|uniref:EAL domain-containing protein n=1 Tax=Campylobacter sputorum TaxID=206 RepID=UPI000B76FCA8|nr:MULTISPECIES: GGDEF domain-containing phosphodiesterase [Campylobacter]ASM40177.1 diguanylate cyclase/phosphodiesterase [Campylobacter sputorum]MBE7358636.1 EAL domain-containing protein [Campylobacter sp. RM11302]MBF6669973.1 EAL domain-containing protein [Campylobacter sp. RM12327]MBF6675115.1 EAL domain-containing protein [Campylobacter sp. RM13538]MBF6676462.1 EAL domain-containing protein [Campylobacter sp. RM12321]
MENENTPDLKTKNHKLKFILIPIILFIFIIPINILFLLSMYYMDDDFRTEAKFLSVKETIDKIEFNLKKYENISDFDFDKYIKNSSESIWMIGSNDLKEPTIYYSSRYPELINSPLSNSKYILIGLDEYKATIKENEIYKFQDISKYIKKVVYFKKIRDDLIIGFDTIYILEGNFAKNHNFTYWIIDNIKSNIIISLLVLAISILAIYILYKFYISFIIKIQDDINRKNNELRNKNKELRQKIYIDSLTGLSNKTAIYRDLKDMQMPKIIVIDIDDFKIMNDYFGKTVCNELLKKLSKILKDFSKQYNLKLYRLIGDQFALLEDSPFDIEKYENMVQDLIAKLKGKIFSIPTPEDTLDCQVELHVTIGMALESENTLEKAFTALKMAKNLNKDYVCYFKEIDQIREFKTSISRSYMINKAIYNNEVMPYFQPIFDKNKNIIKYESLVRIVNDTEGAISPAVFLEVSKKTKRYAEIEMILIDKTFKTLKKHPNTIISLNISKIDMIDGIISSFIIEKLSEYDIGNRVVFEILEDENIENIRRIEDFIKRVKRMGAKIAIDDFGSGYSNFAYLLKLMPDYLKIDGSIIKDIDKDRNSYAITRAIVAFAKDLNIKTIAEFVKSKEVFDICVELNIDEFQGYYLGEPKKDLLY